MSSIAKIATVALAAFASTAEAYPITLAQNCGDSTYEVKFNNVTMNPDPPVEGSPAILYATGITNSIITGGTLALNVLLDGIQLYTANGNTCGSSSISLPLGFGQLNIISLECPTTANSPVVFNMSLTLPTGIPSGDYGIQVTAQDQNNNNAYCVNATFSL